jgi:hypothetical protein
VDDPIVTPDYKPTVWVHGRPLRSRAVCDCGWTGGRRLIRGMARVDAWGHANRTGHLPAANFDTRKANAA